MKKSEQSQRPQGTSAVDIHIRESQGGEKGAERIFEKTTAENFPNERHKPTNPRSSTNPKLINSKHSY